MDASADFIAIAAARAEHALISHGPEFDAERIHLPDLVIHRECLPADLTLERAHDHFSRTGHHFAAVQRGGQVVGICSCERVGLLLGSRFAFPLNARLPALAAAVPHPIIF
jgi:hypothetical protein